LSLIKWEFTLV